MSIEHQNQPEMTSQAQQAFSRLQEFGDTTVTSTHLSPEGQIPLPQGSVGETEEQLQAREDRMDEMENWANKMGAITEAKANVARYTGRLLVELAGDESREANMKRQTAIDTRDRLKWGVFMNDNPKSRMGHNILATVDTNNTITYKKGGRTDYYRSPARMSGPSAVEKREPELPVEHKPLMR